MSDLRSLKILLLFLVLSALPIDFPFLGANIARSVEQPRVRKAILFLDLNISPFELEAAAKAAQKRGDDLIVWPDLGKAVTGKTLPIDEDIALRKKLRVKFEELRTLNEKFNKHLANANNPPLTAKQAARQTELINEESALALQATNGDIEQSLSSFISSQVAGKSEVSTLVVSGHHGTGVFNGSMGRVTDDQLRAVMLNNYSPLDSIRSVYLWACFGATLDEVQTWQSILPRLAIVGGFEGKGPSGSETPGADQLGGALEIEPQLIALHDSRSKKESNDPKLHKEVSRILSSVKNYNTFDSAYSVCSCYFRPRKDAIVLSDDEKGNCSKTELAILKTFRSEFEKYYFAEAGACEPPPNSNNSPLFKYYAQLSKLTGCNEDRGTRDPVLRKKFDDAMTDLKVAFAMRWYEGTKTSFWNANQKDILAANEQLLAAGVKLQFPNIPRTNRCDLMSTVAKFQKAISSLPSNADTDKISLVLRRMQVYLINAECVPYDWHDPVATPISPVLAGTDCDNIFADTIPTGEPNYNEVPALQN